MAEPKFAKGGIVRGPAGAITFPCVYRHNLANPDDHAGHPIRWDGYDVACGIYVVEHLIKPDGYCSVCGAHVVDVEAVRGHLGQLKQPAFSRDGQRLADAWQDLKDALYRALRLEQAVSWLNRKLGGRG
jgi:hypothetical protein